MNSYILSIDQSTSATKAVLFNNKAQIIARASKEHGQFYPKPGWVEHDPEEILNNTIEIIRDISGSNPDKKISALAITNQRETVVVWDSITGKPVYNAVVWQCNRGSQRCKQLIDDGWNKIVRQKTGLLIDPYFSATGISWILENVPDAREKATKGELRFGTIDSWLIWKLTNGNVHATDYSNASRTMLFNINTLEWDNEIMAELGIPMSMAPSVKFADEIFGLTYINGVLKTEIPITGVLGDSHAALFGQLCFEPGMGKATYGTGSSIMMNIGSQPLESPEGLVTSVGYGLNGNIAYVFEGNIHCTGATIKWLQDDLQLIDNASETEAIAQQVSSNEGVYFVPAFAGLGAPYWNNEARAIICGMTRGTKKAHIVRAAIEAIAYQVKDLIDLMITRTGIPLKELRVDGGPVKNNFLMQFQADMLQATINRCNISEASALGVALVAGLSTGIWKNMEELESLRTGDNLIVGKMASNEVKNLYDGWKNAVKRAL
jgi:glycerol kinase